MPCSSSRASSSLIWMIRPLKGVLVALQYANKAEQGRFEPTRPEP